MRFDVSPIYWSPRLYQWTLRMLYGASLDERYQAVAEMIPAGARVVELCCGDGRLYLEFLQRKSVHYVGVDAIPQLTSRLRARGVEVIHTDVRSFQPQRVDYCVMMGALYHFHPDEAAILCKMAEAGTGILLEPVHNITAGKHGLTRMLGRYLSYVGGTSSGYRLDEARLTEVLRLAEVRVLRAAHVMSGKYRLVVFDKA